MQSDNVKQAVFLEKLSAKNKHYAMGEFKVMGSYEKSAVPVNCLCLKCGCVWSPKPRDLLAKGGTGCPECGGTKKKTHSQFMQLFSSENPHSADIDIVGRYQSMKKRIACKCNVCGYEWEPIASQLVALKQGCPNCAGQVMDHERFISNLRVRNAHFSAGEFEVVGEYTRSASGIECRCNTCGHTWKPSANSLITAGCGCPVCAGRYMSNEVFLERFRRDNPHSESLCVESDYRGAEQRIRMRCKNCGYVWEPTASQMINNRSGCPRCAVTQSSFMEQFVYKSFSLALGEGNVKSRDKEAIGLELDIYIPERNLAVEIGSWVFHQYLLDRDAQKRSGEIRVITVYDSMPSSVPSPFEQDFFRYDFDLGQERGHKTLRDLTVTLMGEVGCTPCFDEIAWRQVEAYAYSHSGRKTHEEFVGELGERNQRFRDGEFVILNAYQSWAAQLECRCTICGNEWSARAGDLMRGRSCPKCSHKRTADAHRDTQQGFVKKLKSVNPEADTLEVVGQYESVNKRIQVRCRKCGYEWSPIAQSLICNKPTGCPKCAGQVKTHDDFVREFEAVSPIANDIEFVGRYLNSTTRILVRCKKCGYEWEALPVVMKRKNFTGCKFCRKQKDSKPLQDGL